MVNVTKKHSSFRQNDQKIFIEINKENWYDNSVSQHLLALV